MSGKHHIAISAGDPCGIGPEIIVKTLIESEPEGNLIIIGDFRVFEYYSEILAEEYSFKTLVREKDIEFLDVGFLKTKPDNPGAKAGEAAGKYIEKGVELCLEGKADGLVTCPIDKKSFSKGGYKFPGHTEFLAELTQTSDYRMGFFSDSMRIVLNSTHLSLRDAIERVNESRIYSGLRLIDKEFREFFGNRPNIGVCGLNPHAGEEGLFGAEEIEEIIPALERARSEGIDASGPHAPDTFFHSLLEEEFDIALTMYHDQGLIPIKTLNFLTSVNITLGLPFVRTSVDHGVAYDIVGTGTADNRSFKKALQLAFSLVS